MEKTTTLAFIEDNHINLRDYHIVSLDLVGSSKLEDNWGPKTTTVIFMIIKPIIEKWAKECEGHLFYWAGDGGAVLFKAEPDADIDIYKLQALRFSLGLLFLSWNGALRNEKFNQISIDQPNLLSNSNEAELDKQIDNTISNIAESHVKYIKEFVFNNFPLDTNDLDSWNLNEKVLFDLRDKKKQELLSKLEIQNNNTSELPRNRKIQNLIDNFDYEPKFRIVCHTGTIKANKKDHTISYGEDLSFLLKYERDLGNNGSLTITNRFYEERNCPLNFSNPIGYLRKKRNGDQIEVRIFPENDFKDLHVSLKSIPSSALFETDPITGEELNLVDRIIHYFERNKNNAVKIAKIYNIGLSTFSNHFKDLWAKLINDNQVEIKLLLLQRFEQEEYGNTINHKEREVVNTIDALGDVIKLGIKKAKINKEDANLILSKIQCKILNNDIIHSQIGENDSFGVRFGCSLYFANKSQNPEEGTNIFLTPPFSKWTKISAIDNRKGMWEYTRIFYLSDIYVSNYLQKLNKKFDKLWEIATPIKLEVR